MNGGALASLPAPVADLAAEIDPQAMLDFLEFGYVTEARTIFKEARKVPPATIVEWKAGRREERCYWRLPEASDFVSPGSATALRKVNTPVPSVRLALARALKMGR